MREHEFHYSLSDITEEDSSQETSVVSGRYTHGSASLLLRCLLCAVLEDIRIQLKCLKDYSLSIKCSKDKRNIWSDPYEDIKKFKEHGADRAMVYTKLEADRRYVYEVVQNTYLELIQHNTFSFLKKNIIRYIELENYPFDLFVDNEKNKIIRKQLWKQIKLQRRQIKVQLNDIDGTILKLERTIDDAPTKFDVKRRYVEHWQFARTEQNNLKVSKTESKPLSNINRLKEKYANETKVHLEITRLTSIQITETLNKIEAMMEKYDKDLENIDLQIQTRSNQYYDICTKRMDMEELVEKRETEMRNWIKFKDDREAVRLYNEKMTNGAFVIQAWWRGLLVRLQLGPYAVKKVKKKKK